MPGGSEHETSRGSGGAALARDLSLLVTLGTGALYLLAWIYWSSYCEYFGLTTDFLELRVETIVAAIWPVLIGFVLVCLAVLSEVFDARSIREAALPARRLGFLLILLLSSLVDFRNWPWWLLGSLFVLVFILLLLKNIFLGPYLIRIYSLLDLKARSQRILVVMMGLGLLFGVFSMYGRWHARELAEGRKPQRVRLDTSTPYELPDELVLLGHWGGKYFLCKPRRSNPTPQAIVLDDSDVLKVTVYLKSEGSTSLRE